jgi:hypothetical protein
LIVISVAISNLKNVHLTREAIFTLKSIVYISFCLFLFFKMIKIYLDIQHILEGEKMGCKMSEENSDVRAVHVLYKIVVPQISEHWEPN